MSKEYYTKEVKSKILGKTLIFGNYGTGYIWVDVNGKAGTEGVQLMYNIGNNLRSAYECPDKEGFTKACKAWYNKYIKTFKEGY